MRLMGIDYGEARIGVALSDPEGKIAFPHRILGHQGARRVIAEIKTMVVAEKVERIVIGLPLGFEGQETKESALVRTFAEALKGALKVPLHFENEIFTTRMAEASGGTRKPNDASAAAIILQSYIDKSKIKM